MLFHQPGHIVETGRIRRKLPHIDFLASGKNIGGRLAAILIWTYQRNRQNAGAGQCQTLLFINIQRSF
jgi:hypothetical protein